MRQVWTSCRTWPSFAYAGVGMHPAGDIVKQIAIQVKELVATNLNALVQTAVNPAKMLRLLQAELEEAVIALQGDRAKALRHQARLEQDAARLEQSAGEWTGKAKLAMDHQREDLARAALMAREVAQDDAGKTREAAVARAAEVRELAEAMVQLEAKLAQTSERLRAELANPAAAAAEQGADSRSERMLDRAEQLEQRIAFAQDRPSAPSQQAIDAEIEQLAREARIEQELLAIKAATQPGPGKKPKPGR